ncbi:diphthamide biosynthesis protein 2 [Capsaspora owczarzaki ATCC 30864]|uniref:2-(3-amino-3-carboxypropyl)histidine synthase subunit 2 n=1 Tax=Capsaspora owczarzaki (strain ATCC 30864) TaxID=595528 RepID=A0A0D2X0D3_CAPO3|nr:diphthamide biosynthesis protein 2 [Capsaspora owczarzaki ATCC 30864]KJE88859.1 diphthamide biosynthesis protein 2 [Capsaspora owczarzaki ATCC 30864]|eukprot:XP_004365305.1 diphthamide biosynthesis protein 2 [Capsaspora owczarzaki ATCC 30864]
MTQAAAPQLNGVTAFSTNTDAAMMMQPAASLQASQRPRKTDPALVDDVYEIERCVRQIQEQGFGRIALQFPDTLMVDAPAVAARLKNATGKHVFVLGDTSYGSCCVDEVAAQHVNADLVIHYGRTCLSPPSHLPVIFVFGKQPVNVADCRDKFAQLFAPTEKVIVAFDVTCQHAIPALADAIRPSHPHVVFSVIRTPTLVPKASKLASPTRPSPPTCSTASGTVSACGTATGVGCGCSTGCSSTDASAACCSNPVAVPGACSRQPPSAPTSSSSLSTSPTEGSRVPANHALTHNESVQMQINATPRSVSDHAAHPTETGRIFVLPDGDTVSEYAIFYVGQESLTLTNLMMTYNSCQFFSYDPVSTLARKEALNVSRALMRRYFLIQKAKEAQTVGIIAGTLGVADYMTVIERLKRLCKDAGKKTYVFVMGKLNVAKLANFMEIDVFVLVACPENSLIDSQDFFKPVVTPFELELACVKGKEWTGAYVTDFRQILPRLAEGVDESSLPIASEDEEVPEFSFISQSMRPMRSTLDDPSLMSAGEIQLRNMQHSVAVHSPAADFLASRSFRGLEQQLGETQVVAAVEGRRGIASGYTDEQPARHDS